MAGESPSNPYAPTEALQHELPPAQPSGRGIGYRIGAIVLAILAFPLSGAGFYILGRPQRLARWLAAGLGRAPCLRSLRTRLGPDRAPRGPASVLRRYGAL